MSPTSNHDNDRPFSPMDEAAAYAALSRVALTNRPLDQALTEVAELAKAALPETPEASVTLLTDDQARTAAFSGDLALQLDERQYHDGYGPCMDAAVSGGTINVTMADPGSPYPDFRQLARRHRVTHSLSVGLPAAGRTIGALNLYTSTGHGFSHDSTRIAGTFAGFTGLILATLGRYDDTAADTAARLQHALRSRAVISQAHGILISEHHCSLEEASTALLRIAQQQGMKLQDAAQALVDKAGSS